MGNRRLSLSKAGKGQNGASAPEPVEGEHVEGEGVEGEGVEGGQGVIEREWQVTLNQCSVNDAVT